MFRFKHIINNVKFFLDWLNCMLARKSLADHNNLFSSHGFKKNYKNILN